MSLRQRLRDRNRPFIYKSVDELIHDRKKTRRWVIIDAFMYAGFIIFAWVFLYYYMELYYITDNIVVLLFAGIMVFNWVLHFSTHRYFDMVTDKQNKQYIELIQYLKENIEKKEKEENV